MTTIQTCEWHDRETEFVASISFPLIRWARSRGYNNAPEVLLSLLLSGLDSGSEFFIHLGLPGQRFCLRRMENGLQRRMDTHRGNHPCPDGEELLADAVISRSTHPEHIKSCSHCRSELGWLRSHLPDYAVFNQASPR